MCAVFFLIKLLQYICEELFQTTKTCGFIEILVGGWCRWAIIRMLCYNVKAQHINVGKSVSTVCHGVHRVWFKL